MLTLHPSAAPTPVNMAFEADDEQIIGTKSTGGDARLQLQMLVAQLEAICCHCNQELSGGAAEPLEGRARIPEVHLEKAREILEGLRDADVPLLLLEGLIELDFEARKMAQRLLCAAVRLATLVADDLTADYVRDHPRILQLLLEGCGTPELALHCSLVLQSCTRCARLSMLLLHAGAAFKLLDLTRHPSFDVSSDALASLHDLLLPVTHSTCLPSAAAGMHQAQISAQVAIYVEANFSDLISGFHKLLEPDAGYVVQRQALRLLRKVLHRRSYEQVMQKYVCNARFLQIHMNLMLDRSRAIQCEAFCIFKLFVTNPKQPTRVQRILAKNSERIVRSCQYYGKCANDIMDCRLGSLSVANTLSSARLLHQCQSGSAAADKACSFIAEDIDQVLKALSRSVAQPQPMLHQVLAPDTAPKQENDLLDSLVAVVLQGCGAAVQPGELRKVSSRTPQEMQNRIGEALRELWQGPQGLGKGLMKKASWKPIGGLHQLDILLRIWLDLSIGQITFGMPFLCLCLQQLLSHLGMAPTGRRMLEALPMKMPRLQ
mmetsp:Transcript_102339/g.180321  ORF Transcript_102339/g.180321 Transcript_102339/m.180321 type:complete len:546 (-) Transcript_102339:112-1749(-)